MNIENLIKHGISLGQPVRIGLHILERNVPDDLPVGGVIMDWVRNMEETLFALPKLIIKVVASFFIQDNLLC